MATSHPNPSRDWPRITRLWEEAQSTSGIHVLPSVPVQLLASPSVQLACVPRVADRNTSAGKLEVTAPEKSLCNSGHHPYQALGSQEKPWTLGEHWLLGTPDICPELFPSERAARVHSHLVRTHRILPGPLPGTRVFYRASVNLYLLRVGQVELGSQVDDLQLDNIFLCCEGLGHFPQDVRCNLGDVLTVLANEPQDAGSGHGHL